MKIQLITSRQIQKQDYPNITISEFDKPLALDDFDVDIIDLNSDKFWRTKETPLTESD